MSTRFEKLETRWVSSKWLNKPVNPKTSLVNGEALKVTNVHYSSWVFRNWSHLVPLKGLGEGRADWLNSLSRKKRDTLFNLKEEASLVTQMVKNLPSMRETWVWSLHWEDALEKEMAIHSRILARKIPWTETPGRLQSREWQRVGPYQLQKLIKPGASLVAQYRRCGFNPWSRKIPYAMEQLSP